MFTVAVIGRPNVGKSSLFNRLVKRRLAIVHDSSGTTRDIKECTVDLGYGSSFSLLDTAGIEVSKDALACRMSAGAISAAASADLILFVVDAKKGPTPADRDLADKIRRMNKDVILVANKAENMMLFESESAEFFSLGFKKAIPVSTAHSIGISALKEAIMSRVTKRSKHEILSTDEAREIIRETERMDAQEGGGRIRVALIGQPNVGKSTLANRLLGRDRLVTSEKAGTTRDAIDVDFSYRGRDLTLIDTAGLRRKNRIIEELEGLAAGRSIDAIKKSDVCVLVVDVASSSSGMQNLKIADFAVSEGKGLVIVINKIDLALDPKGAVEYVRKRLDISFSQVKDIPVVVTSAKRGSGIGDMMRAVFELYDLSSLRIPTARLNKWLEAAVAKTPPPNSRLKRPMGVKYITQAGVRPPSFVLFVGGAGDLPENYKRYLVNSLGEEFGFARIAVRLKVKSSANPYSGGERKTRV
ncbi:MAG: ribosome biogenesis GTPase Der [Rickettsiales bacterium]|jgi:GTP-binding protein|nr:ribosome biogenesis GTPase Der [Rickettsiales bacterium]